jgi:DNA-binding YbaB/EbfC family protein
MTQNDPFGGLDMNALLQQAQAMQAQMVNAQEELARTEFDGTVADGLVTVTVDGTGEMRRVAIRANSFDPAEPEDLEDLIMAAYRDARARSQAKATELLGPLAGGLGELGGGDEQGGGGPSPLGF